MLNKDCIEIQPYFESLKVLSLNDSGTNLESTYLVDSLLLAVNFDLYTESKYPPPYERPSSSDALFFAKQFNYFIEFKDRDRRGIKKKSIYKKICDSIATLVDQTLDTEEIIREKYRYVLVHNFELQPEQKIGKFLRGFAKKEYIAFGLEQFKGTYLENIYVVNPDQFDNEFIDKHFVK